MGTLNAQGNFITRGGRWISVSEWVLKGAFIKTATFPEFNWSTENTAVELQVALGIDYAVLNF